MTLVQPKIIADFETQLATAMAVSAVTATLSSATDDDGVALPTGLYYFTIDNGTSAKEYISCTLTGTALTAIKSVTRQGAEVSGCVRAHRVGASVIISDFATYKAYMDNAALSGAVDATLSAKGIVQLATQAEVLAKTATGSTGAALMMTPDLIASTLLSDYKVDTGSANTYAIAPAPAITAYTVGQRFTFKAVNANTTASTINVNSLGAKDIKKNSTLALDAGDIRAGQIVEVEYDGTNFQMISPFGNTAVGTVITGETDQSQATSNGTQAVGEANATSKASIIAEKFTAGATSIKGAKLWKIADTGSFTGTVKVSLQADTAGSPSGSDLASYTISNAAWLKLTAAAEFAVTFSTQYSSLVPGTSYWIVVTPSTSDNSNHPNLGLNTAGGYAGALKYNNSTDGWVLVATSMLYFKTTQGTVSKIVQTGTDGLVLPVVSPTGLVSVHSSQTTVTGTVTETTVLTKQIEGGFFTTTSGIRARAYINFTSTIDAATTNINLKYNGSTLATVAGPGSQGTGWKEFDFMAEFIVIGNSSQSSQIIFQWISVIPKTKGSGTISAGTLANQFALDLRNPFGSSAIDLSQPGALTITVTNSTASGTTTTIYLGSIIERIA